MPECSDRYAENLKRGPLSPHRRSDAGLVQPERSVVRLGENGSRRHLFSSIHVMNAERSSFRWAEHRFSRFSNTLSHKQRAKEMTYFRFRETGGVGRDDTPNETREGTNAKSSMLRGEGEKEVKRSPAPVALKIWQVVQFLMHISCRMAPVLGSQEGMRIFLSFPYFLMGAFGALYSR